MSIINWPHGSYIPVDRKSMERVLLPSPSPCRVGRIALVRQSVFKNIDVSENLHPIFEGFVHFRDASCLPVSPSSIGPKSDSPASDGVVFVQSSRPDVAVWRLELGLVPIVSTVPLRKAVISLFGSISTLSRTDLGIAIRPRSSTRKTSRSRPASSELPRLIVSPIPRPQFP